MKQKNVMNFASPDPTDEPGEPEVPTHDEPVPQPDEPDRPNPYPVTDPPPQPDIEPIREPDLPAEPDPGGTPPVYFRSGDM